MKKKHRLQARLTSVGTAMLLAGVLLTLPISPAGAATGHLATVRTASEARLFLLSMQHTTPARLKAALMRLTPASRQYVIQKGLMPYRVVFSRTESPAHRADGGVNTSSCASFYHTTVGKADVYSWIGIHLYHYQSSWQWSGMCYVWAAGHQENGWGVMTGWSYAGSSYGAPYGKIGSPMVGRETFGTFNFNLVVGQQDVVDATMLVYGYWGTFPDGKPAGAGDYWYWAAHQ